MSGNQLNSESLERELLHKIALGDQKAFTELFERYQALVYSYVLRLIRSQSAAEDVVQNVFIKLWVNREQITQIQNFGAYINRMARNQSYTALRKIAADALRMVELTHHDFADPNDSEQRTLYNESARLLNAAVDFLPPQRKLVYQMCHEQGLKYEEVAAKLNISSGTVHKHMKLALKSIRTHLQDIDATLLLFILLIKK